MPVPLLSLYSGRAPFFLVFIAVSHFCVCQMENAEASGSWEKNVRFRVGDQADSGEGKMSGTGDT